MMITIRPNPNSAHPRPDGTPAAGSALMSHIADAAVGKYRLGMCSSVHADVTYAGRTGRHSRQSRCQCQRLGGGDT